MAAPSHVENAIYDLITQGVGPLGLRVNRAAAVDPQNVWTTIFTIAGGPIILTSLVGVRTIIQAGGASTMQFRHSVGPTVLDNGALVITGDTVGTLYTLDGDALDPILSGLGGIPVFTAVAGIGLFLSAGNIQVIMTAAVGTGSTRYVLRYIPIDSASVVT